MIYINERIKELRHTLGLSQQEFAKKLNVNQAAVSYYEKGIRTPLDAIVTSICREFNVNERWLRTGEGPMFRPQTGDDQLMAALGDIALGEDSFRRRFIAALATMPPENWKVLEALLRKTLEEEDKKEEA